MVLGLDTGTLQGSTNFGLYFGTLWVCIYLSFWILRLVYCVFVNDSFSSFPSAAVGSLMVGFLCLGSYVLVLDCSGLPFFIKFYLFKIVSVLSTFT